MPNPLTSEERARLCEYLHDLCDENRWINHEDRCNLRKAADALARTADDARDARRYRYVRDANIRDYDVLCEPRSNYLRMSAALDESIDAALASSKSEAAEGGEDG